MKKQITNISGHQTSKVLVFIYLLLVTPLFLIGAIGFLISAEARNASSVFVMGALLYSVFVYVLSRLACFVYNVVAQRIGGFEFTISDVTSR